MKQDEVVVEFTNVIPDAQRIVVDVLGFEWPPYGRIAGPWTFELIGHRLHADARDQRPKQTLRQARSWRTRAAIRDAAA